MKKGLLYFITFLLLFSARLSAQQSTAQDQKMAWWREARFGMFIHWGPYALWGGNITDISSVSAVQSGL